ncbi:hypothetical protein RJ641_017006 [Dillenia turbinata]|uniref:Uncharacterized protein n=1 Tax=Dillenia turbinata TaxID=194707 RepID=A0AAN8YXA3_9MAGN
MQGGHATLTQGRGHKWSNGQGFPPHASASTASNLAHTASTPAPGEPRATTGITTATISIRVDCNTFEILEQHKKGKKHKKKESLNKVMMGTIRSPVKLPVEDSKCDKASSDDTKGGRDQQKNLPEKVKNPVAEMKEDQAGEQKTDHSGVRGRGMKCHLRGGQEAKRMRTNLWHRKAECPKSKELVRHILPRATATAFESASETHQQQIPNRVMSEVSNVAPPQAIPPDLPVKDPPASHCWYELSDDAKSWNTCNEEVDEFIIGIPKSFDGKEAPQSNKVRRVAERLVVRAAER